MQPGQPSEVFWQRVMEIAKRCAEHPFMCGIADGTLPVERYAAYVAQDSFYLHSFARAYAVGLARMSEPEEMQSFRELLNGVFDEMELHRRSAHRWHIDLARVRPAAVTSAYSDFLLANAFTGTPGELLACMTPCMRLYAFLGQDLQRYTLPDSPYVDWVRTYSSSEMEALTCTIEALLDRHGRATEKEFGLYRRAMQLEERFFDAAWRGEMSA